MRRAPDSFRTSRLVAERIESRHLPDLIAMNGDHATMAPIGGTRSAKETASYLERNLQHWNDHGFGMWMLRLADTGAFVGRAGLRNTHREDAEETELAYALVHHAWGLGLATEVGRAVIEIAFESLGASSVVALTRTDNLASRRVMEKLGLRHERDLEQPDGVRVMYRIEGRSLLG